jgi:hypothetical protein
MVEEFPLSFFSYLQLNYQYPMQRSRNTQLRERQSTVFS